MKRKFSLMIALLLLVLTVSVAAAQTGGGYDLTWSAIDNGGGTLSGGTYSLDGTIGQPDAGIVQGGSYRLNGGFLTGLDATLTPSHDVFLPLILH